MAHVIGLPQHHLVCSAARSLNADAWRKAHKHVPETARNPLGHIVGIIGLGDLGFTIARKTYAAFGVKIYYHDLVRKSGEQEKAVEATFCSTVICMCRPERCGKGI